MQNFRFCLTFLTFIIKNLTAMKNSVFEGLFVCFVAFLMNSGGKEVE